MIRFKELSKLSIEPAEITGSTAVFLIKVPDIDSSDHGMSEKEVEIKISAPFAGDFVVLEKATIIRTDSPEKAVPPLWRPERITQTVLDQIETNLIFENIQAAAAAVEAAKPKPVDLGPTIESVRTSARLYHKAMEQAGTKPDYFQFLEITMNALKGSFDPK